ncbi:helix-turn-helix domain-containing protein [Enterococcus faecium]|uniref:helix-turn-helix domain-containing protein n=1 Tax=Enterococcus faecium TaxID=1352 RepID=UPI000F4EAF83|nr:helix-turn-helix transcriptional regulator [Enterococcus faecium]MEB6143562.1 helix-turn-helix domain-containing protein [Enterococcus faecium]ROW78762.1 XRE family transcriptional regulator [Enterococcus faecium]
MNRLKEMRKENNITLVDLSAKLGIPRSTLNRYENGESEPKQETWEKLADYFNVSVGYLMGVSNQKVSEEKALEIAKETYYRLLNSPEEIDEREFKALKYFENRNLENLLKEIMAKYFSIPVVLKNKKYSNLEDLTWLEGMIPYESWEKYRMEHKTNHNLIDKIYYSLPIGEDVTLYKAFDTHRKTIQKNNSNRIELITHLFENAIDEQLESELLSILDETFDKINNLRSKYPDKPSDIKQVTQALIYDNNTDEHSYSFWRRVDGTDTEDETHLSEEEKQELVKIATQMNKETNI